MTTWSRKTWSSWILAVDSDGTRSAWSACSSAGPPSPPPKRTVVAPALPAAARPRTTFGERPLVEKATTTSPALHERLHLSLEDLFEGVVVRDAGERGGVDRERLCRQRTTLATKTADELLREVVRVD